MWRKILGLSAVFLTISIGAADEISLEEIYKIKNDKEVLISSFSKRDRDHIVAKYTDQNEIAKVKKTFYSTLHQFLNQKKQCELQLINLLEKNFAEAGLPNDQASLEEQLKLIRVYNGIDDILYDILSGDNKDYFALKKVNVNKNPAIFANTNEKILEKNDVKELYSNFENFPDEINNCAYGEFTFIKNKIKDEDGKKAEKPLKIMKGLNKKAYHDKIISLESYNKLEFLRTKSGLSKRIVWLDDYIKIILQAKNQMVSVSKGYKPINLADEDKFSSERMKRFTSLTRRKILYRKYTETQIIMLAQVLQKASRRMGVDVDTESGTPYITQEFTVNEANGERRTYVERFDLDPQSQFNLARRLMRKDILDLQMMDTFVGLNITYDDVVSAAFETGYISIEDITYVVRYDDLWNPETSKYERVSNFVFKIAGYSSFFLPPPWNIVGAIAIGVVEGIVSKKFQTGAENDNPATFIE